MDALFGVLGLLGFVVGLVWLIISLVRKRSKKIPALVLVFGLVVFIGALAVTPEPSNAEEPSASPKSSHAEDLGISEELYGEIKDAYTAVGIDSIKELEVIEGGSTYQLIYEDYYITAAITEDGSLGSVKSGDRVFWEDGEVVSKADDVIVTTSEFLDLAYKSERVIKDNLKSPSTAKFPGHILERSEWTITKNKPTYYVKSWVDSQNSFGAMIRSEFIVQYEWDGSSDTEPTVIDLAIE